MDAPLTEALLAEASLVEAPEIVSVVPVGFITPASVSAGGGCLKVIRTRTMNLGENDIQNTVAAKFPVR